MTTHTCPQCLASLHAVKVTTHGGSPFEVEQCSECGGMWFDKFEHHRLSKEDVEKLDPLNESALERLSKQTVETQKCPKDNTKLFPFSDFNFPKDLQIGHCLTCGGLWFNKGDFGTYRSTYQKKKPPEKQLSRGSRIANAFLTLHSLRKKKAEQEKVKEINRAVSREITISYITYLLRTPVGLLAHISLFAYPLWVLFTKTLEVSQKNEGIYLDFEEFKALIQEVSKDIK